MPFPRPNTGGSERRAAARCGRRRLALERAAGFLERGRAEGETEAPALAPEATAAGIQAVLHARLANGRGGLPGLRGELMYVAVLPYRGAEAAAAAMAAE